MLPDYKLRVKNAILNQETFISATFSGRQASDTAAWIKVVLRPVLVKSKSHIQISYFDARKDITKNYRDTEIVEKLDELLNIGFRHIHVESTEGNFQVQITKKGRAVIHEHKPTAAAPDLSHDRRKNVPITADTPDAFLQAVGIMTQDGKIRAGMGDKFTQINEFLKLVAHTEEFQRITSTRDPLYVVDAGCGNAYLTFAMYHYLNNVLGIAAHITGIDTNGALLSAHADKVKALGWDKLTFQATSIIDFQPERAPDIVLALHACDTATDEALAQAVSWGSRLIFSAPCCHRHLQHQLEQQSTPLPFLPVLRQGILKERLGDILTDSFRALILRIMGYKTDVVEFVSSEHTGKNLLIRAAKTTQAGEQKFVDEYNALKDYWHVTPYLEALLSHQLRPTGTIH